MRKFMVQYLATQEFYVRVLCITVVNNTLGTNREQLILQIIGKTIP